MNLKMKGITEKLIMNCMDEIDSSDYEKTIIRIFENYYATKKGLKAYQKRSKTISHLLSKGYEYDVVLEVISNDEDLKLT
ncbi:recombination regulator RecX [compost metagenome]